MTERRARYQVEGEQGMSLLNWLFGVKMPVIPENTWTWRVEAYSNKKPNRPRRVSRKPNHVRTRVKRGYDTGYYKRNSEKLRQIEEILDGMLLGLR